MANIRRVVRKVPPSAAHYFDEQLWPIYIALVVLGGFLMGVTLAYQPLAGAAPGSVGLSIFSKLDVLSPRCCGRRTCSAADGGRLRLFSLSIAVLLGPRRSRSFGRTKRGLRTSCDFH